MKKIKKKYYFYFPVYFASISSWMVQGAVSKKRNIKEKTLVTFLKKRNEKTHPFVPITFQSQVWQVQRVQI
jgi:ammonia channel protein AmtB